MTDTQNTLLTTICSAARQYQADTFTYNSHIMWDYPQHAIYINQVMLHPHQFDIPQEFRQSDLDILADNGYFEKIKETTIDEVSYETEVLYRIVKQP